MLVQPLRSAEEVHIVIQFMYAPEKGLTSNRFSGFYCLGMLSSGFSSIIAYEIQKMKGIGGLNGWRWIFILVSIVLPIDGALVSHNVGRNLDLCRSCRCLCSTHWLPWQRYLQQCDQFNGVLTSHQAARPGLFRTKAFLNANEATILLARIQRDRGDAVEEKLTFRGLLPHLRDWKVWEMAVLLMCNVCVSITSLLTAADHIYRTWWHTLLLIFFRSFYWTALGFHSRWLMI